ncbi:MAG TPA: type II secretion system F family protein [Microbacteriaceae bacterium]|jgi:tight adherence protein C|nr:type II secretion system F family protein [Microbacteriaceae bacterium]HQX36440.1 type II secretion system F family protein [Microbacteriaceae bacterium]HQZ47645.1 type II secretion system F family protein [Microbacteriaceae bacterium]HRA09367.1 type II secretion system F family protein [Microbacteriaceae bacterium]
MMTDAAIAVLFGAAFGLGCWMLLGLTARWGAMSLAARVGPYVRDVVAGGGGAGFVDVGSGPVAGPGSGAVLRAALLQLRGRITGILGGSESIERRLEQAARQGGIERFRGIQLLCALLGLLAGAVCVVVFALAGVLRPPALVLPIVAGAVGVVACDLFLSSAARRRVSRIQEELPTVLEFLSLCLAAGEGLLDSLRRVTAVGAGEFLGELRIAVIDAGTGSSLADGLGGVARRLQMPAVTRAVDQLVAAIERGAPLAAVLQAQAADAREDAKRVLIERAGKNEIGMLVPLVFLILPLSVVFAIFPAGQLLQLGIG